MDTDVGSELFVGYESDFTLILADLSRTLTSLPPLRGEPRKSAISSASRLLEEGQEIIAQMELEVLNIPSATRGKVNARLREHKKELQEKKTELRKLSATSDRELLFGDRGASPMPGSEGQEQRDRLLTATDRLERSSQRLRDSQRIAHETEDIGAGILGDLRGQREQIVNTRNTLMEADGYVDKSLRTLKGMARRYVICHSVAHWLAGRVV
ncbi:t-SNARE VTI1 [Saitoella coloradoensis]